ncbi:hypothetical protein RND71_034420 [Anisodus tanguticus]|uniref:Leucine-rich repeat-containing N-terminal plant-type domain-containing protein n=1 Tax=Anisodus tanguticus TaxID=243964 RepID=A0AAE1RBC9_9SOLA|nr:hypothetical protein RND71_034420 [Anisodus tanguticus]
MLAFVFVLLHHFTASSAIIPNIGTDEAALLAFKSHISSDPNNVLASNWSSSSPVCSCIGITCSGRHHRVTALDISSTQHHGTVPPHLGNLSFLVFLDISNNTFHGDLPEELVHLQRLKLIDITRNNFSGVIPSFLSLLPNLRFVYLSNNEFSGEILSSFSNLTSLEELRMQRNFLHGEIPPEIGDLRYLTFLDLQDIRNNLPNLEVLLLSSNYLDGLIPPNLEKCSKLQLLTMSGNEFTGTVPENLTPQNLSMQCQAELIMFMHFTLIARREIFNISALQMFTMYGNQLSGSLPSDLGPIPDSLGALEFLKVLYLGDNNFINEPYSSELRFVSSLTNCRYLREVVIEDNPLDGFLPASVGKFSDSFRIFVARRTKLKGTIPEEIGNLSGLRVLALSHNEFTSFIPEKLRNMQNLQEFYLENNSLGGTIPDICSLQNLGSLNLTGNQICGRIHPEAGNLMAVTLIDLSKNDFSGNIPSTMGGLEKLISLSMSHNKLEGAIPSTFGKMVGLEFLDFSYNNLTSETPKPLQVLSHLKNFNISFNKLRGEIPSGGPFANFTSLSFISNDALCGDYRFNVSPCLIKSTKKSRRRRALAGLYIVLGQTDVSLVKRHERISYHELQQTTEGFSESNLLGSGSFCMVYKGILQNGTLLAAKETFTGIRPSDEIFTGDMSLRYWIKDAFPSGVGQVVDADLLRPEEEHIKAKTQCALSIMELALSCTLVSPDARVNIEDALSALKKIRHQFATSCAMT